MRPQISRKVLVTLLSLLTAGLLLTSTSTVTAQVLYDDFNDNTLDPLLWTVSEGGIGPTITETNQRLEIASPEDSMDGPDGMCFAQYTSVCLLRGDYDVQVDYQLLTWPPGNGVRVGLNTQIGTTERDSFGTPADFGGQPREVYLTHFADGFQGMTRTTDLSGKLRQARSGNTVTGYYYSISGDWVAIHTGPAAMDDVNFSLASWTHDYAFIDQAVKVAFDNVIVNQGQLICPKLRVLIDIKPGSFPSSINPRKKGTVPVAILTTASFDASTVDPATVAFGPNGTAPGQSGLEDADGDGDIDMVLHFETQDTGIQCGDTSATLTGQTFDGQMIEGSDPIKTAGC